ncbi:hypothetical protein [Salipiger sp. PrR003]|uniref:hypothetical protein n=1 Tax=Salipiger sp. PrR003 TaxID=2706776 RepID=UPI0013DA7F2C|nr:hypothetical protein [Salipiger sp. PrR003]NDV52159.1 hypothetical protein [Salipiger sp. PrR003]NDV52185.1 hypothetical protein [Salipiger sp. PrR003]
MPLISKAQLQTFEQFFSTDLADGALKFEAVDPISETSKTFRFVGTYSIGLVASFFEVSAELEILP